jgi:hypothetical protein
MSILAETVVIATSVANREYQGGGGGGEGGAKTQICEAEKEKTSPKQARV